MEDNANKSILNVSFYMFVDLTPIAPLKEELRAMCSERGIKGSVILAYEGINAMLAGPAEELEEVLTWLVEQRDGLAQMPIKRSWTDYVPFKKLMIKVKSEIVTMREDNVDAIGQTGSHLPAEQMRDWLRAGEEMVLIDVRNDFECQIGTFRGAINPKTTAFHEFPAWVRAHRGEWDGKKVVMFCTGGIRCEKATSWMLDEGVEQMYQLEGGIITYFEQIEDAEKDWDGDLFVFDERVTIDTNLNETDMTMEQVKAMYPSQSPGPKKQKERA